jgi:uncharacterized protein YceK
MLLSKKIFFIFIITSTSLLSGCASSFIEKKDGSEKVAVIEASGAAGCESKGKVNSSVVSKVWFVTRSADEVEANLLQLARNSAIENKADTIVKGDSKQFGERTFSLYKCRP